MYKSGTLKHPGFAEVHHHVDIRITVSYYHSYEGVSGVAYSLISKPHCYTCQFKYVFWLEESVSCVMGQNSLGQTKFNNYIGKQQLELSTGMWSCHAP